MLSLEILTVIIINTNSNYQFQTQISLKLVCIYSEPDVRISHMDYMAHALLLARQALGNVSPNPAVGVVIVRDGEIVGQGYTQPPGLAHAEIVALRQAGDKAKGSTLYVTLEPCCHHGRTPPCTKSIIEAGVSEVHFATTDPNPLVNGKGRGELERNGIRTYAGEHEADAAELNEAYIKFITTGIPFVTVKFAASLDGKIATHTSESRWISGEESRKYVHYLRYTHDAVMTGVNTVLADDPSLVTTYTGNRPKQPVRIILDTHGRTPATARLFKQPGKTILVTGGIGSEEKDAYRQEGADLLEMSAVSGRIELENLLKVLGSRSITSVLVEGGGTLLGSLFDRRLVDKVIGFIAPVIIGGETARSPVGGSGIAKIADVLRLKRVKIERFGEDVMISGYPRG